jgi:hypothetical protein
VMPPATEAVMSVVPRERAGAGSALTNVARQVSGALGVAVLGSVLAQAYRGQLGPHLGALPAAARGAATGSIEATQAVAAKLGSGSIAGRDLAVFADSAFVHAMHITTLISAVITLLGALVVVAWMPGRGADARRAAAAEAPARATEVAGHGELVPAAAGRPAGPAALEANAAPEVSAPLEDAVATGAAATPASRRDGAEWADAHAGDPVRAEGQAR